MIVSHITVQNFRSHSKTTLPITKNTTIITGPNGSGKTSLIEAIYIALRGSSFRGSIADILKQDAHWWRADIKTSYLDDVVVKFQPETLKPKQFIIKDKISARLPVAARYPVVLFEPEDMRLLHGSPERRRRFLDQLLSQLYPHYTHHLRRYERALKQRNNLLKQNAPEDSLFVWNVALSDHGAEIMKMRTDIIESINKHLEQQYQRVANNTHKIVISYSHPYTQTTKQKLLNLLHASIAHDKVRGATSVGPHRHDIHFLFNNIAAASVVSRGEARTILLALKYIEALILEDTLDKKPVILLDDVLSELDETHQKSLRGAFKEYQTIVTGTHISWPEEEAEVVELT